MIERTVGWYYKVECAGCTAFGAAYLDGQVYLDSGCWSTNRKSIQLFASRAEAKATYKRRVSQYDSSLSYYKAKLIRVVRKAPKET